ncbi:hypothetical protein V5O48_006114 [Marasmius crinis-equi]|uniref:Ubiquitin-like protease family profile domain-containing protein n=1 Tax=Marasmius crinis-equi TaxID=585013 RepID=A0ABR3FKE7_9AGAR
MPPDRRAISLGQALKSPIKKQGKSDKQQVSLDVQKRRREILAKRIAQLRQPRAPSPVPSSRNFASNVDERLAVEAVEGVVDAEVLHGADTPPAFSDSMPSTPPLPPNDNGDKDLLSELPGYHDEPSIPESPAPTPTKSAQATPKRRRRQKKRTETTAGTTEDRPDLVDRWKELVKTLQAPFLLYKERTLGVATGQDGAPVHRCTDHCTRSFKHCRCQSLAQSLVLHGFFPTAPSQPRMAISIRLLEFYKALCEQSSDAVAALAGALDATYRRRGFRILDSKGNPVKDPLRRSLSQALQWYDTLQLGIDRSLDDALEALKPNLPQLPDTLSALPQPHAVSGAFEKLATELKPELPSEAPQSQKLDPSPEAPRPQRDERATEPPLTAGRVAGYLQRLCPACFGGERFGSSFKLGGDIHVAIDATFGHRHLKSAGDGVEFHTSYRILTKAEVDAVGTRIETERKKAPKPYDSGVSDDVVNADREAFHAAQGDNNVTGSKRFDENGLMALVCRHDIPLLAASIDTPGEQQKYPIALLEEFFKLLPPQATVAVLYDIACVVDRSVHIYDILDSDVVSRIIFATAVMHAYGHQWACQLYYNPRLRPGLGLTDGEGTERLWSALRKLIGLERRSSRARRIWLLDRQCDSIAQEHREDLGAFIERKLVKYVRKKEAESVRQLREGKMPVKELQALWQDQRQSQTSKRALAPARLKKELAKVLKLQAEIDALEITIASTKATIDKLKFPPSDSTMLLSDLQHAHAKLKKKANDLYSALNIPQNHPSLANVPLDYVHALLIARDLKYDIRKRAISTIQEYDQIDRAVGGAHEALGTRSHQLARKNMAKRKTAFENLIRRFNQSCAYLEANYKDGYNIPVPRTLPVNISSLRDADSCDLWEDVWITNSTPPPRWLTDDGVRKGIRAVITLERCTEERQRLAKEAANLCLWFRDELYALLVLSSDPQYIGYRSLIQLRIREHLLLAETWSNPFTGRQIFESQIVLVWTRLFPIAQLPPIGASPAVPTTLPDAPLQPAYTHEVQMAVDSGETGAAETAQAPGREQASTTGVEEESGEESDREGNESTDEEGVGRVRCDSDSEDEDEFGLTWQLPSGLKFDLLLHQCLRKGYVHPTMVGRWRDTRELYSLGVRIQFRGPEFDRMDSPTAWLDEDCINGIAHLIRERNTGVKCAFISSYTIPTLMKDGDYTGLWKTIRPSRYWTHDKWLIPIHSTSSHHWALAVVKAKERQILLFDSFADRGFMSTWAPRIRYVVTRLVKLAQDQGETLASPSFLCLSDWTAQPLEIHRKQLNGYDCGVWILWVIAAVMRGYDYAPLDNSDVGAFRKYLARTIQPQTFFSIMSHRKEQRFLLYRPDLDPKGYSKSDFCYAVAPICRIYMAQTGGTMDTFAIYASDFFFNVWPYPHSLWAKRRREMRLQAQWDFIQDLCNEIRFCEANGRDGTAKPGYEGTEECWEDSFRDALRKSNFHKWADDAYAMANVLPQVLDPRTRSQVDEKMFAAFLGLAHVDCNLLMSFQSLCR